jgi:hypothetical protein
MKFSKCIENEDPERFQFFAIYFKNIMKKMNFEQVGRNCFNPK